MANANPRSARVGALVPTTDVDFDESLLDVDPQSSRVETLVLGADQVNADEKGERLEFEGTHDYNARLELVDVEKGSIDQSGAHIHVKGGAGKYTVMNKFKDCDDIEVNQDGTLCVTEPSENSVVSAVNHVEGVKNYKQSMNDSVIIVDSRKKKGGGITAHTIIGGDTTAHITMSNSSFIVMK